ncbi:hypothetical protein D3C81_797500 [compost metagenome]
MHAIGRPRVVGGEGGGAQVQVLCGRVLRGLAVLLQRQVGGFRGQVAARVIFYFHFHDVLLIDSLDTAPVVVRQDALSVLP